MTFQCLLTNPLFAAPVRFHPPLPGKFVTVLPESGLKTWICKMTSPPEIRPLRVHSWFCFVFFSPGCPMLLGLFLTFGYRSFLMSKHMLTLLLWEPAVSII